jgi:hypothetical protein
LIGHAVPLFSETATAGELIFGKNNIESYHKMKRVIPRLTFPVGRVRLMSDNCH